MRKSFFLTTPLWDTGDGPRLEQLSTAVIADVLSRYNRMRGYDVCFLTGTGDVGLDGAVETSGPDLESAVEMRLASFRKTWEQFEIQFDAFLRASDPVHSDALFQLTEHLEESGYLYLDDFEEGEKDEGPGETTQAQPSEKGCFFKLSGFQEQLISFYEDNGDFVLPAQRMSEIISLARRGLKDVAIARSFRSRGTRMPNQPELGFSPWVTELATVLSGVGFGSDEKTFKRRWPADVQVAENERLAAHAIYWPALLMAVGLEPPRHIVVSGELKAEAEQSEGGLPTMDQLADSVPGDYVRYFLMREELAGNETVFSYSALGRRVNSDLANDVGNLVSRTLKMIDNYFDGVVPEMGIVEAGDAELLRFCRETVELYRKNFDQLQFGKALDNVWELVSSASRYLVANEPWVLARSRDKRERLGSVLYNAAEAARIMALLLGPVVPCGSGEILKQLGYVLPEEAGDLSAFQWGGLRSGTPIHIEKAIYPRLNVKRLGRAAEAKPSRKGSPDDKKMSQKEQISIEDFAKVEMRVGRIVQAERVPKSSKLLKLRVDLGNESRQVVAGIGGAYDPEKLVDRLVAVVTNLEPVKLMGLESNGMIVAASEKGRPVLTTFTEKVKLGSRLR